MRWKSHVRCGAGEKVESGVRMLLRPYLSLSIIIKADDNKDVSALKEMVRNINNTVVSAEDILSDRVYHYVRKSKELKIA